MHLIVKLAIARKFSLCIKLDILIVIRAKTASRPRPVALSRHGYVKSRMINGQMMFSGKIGGQIDRETIGIIKLKYGIAGDHRAFHLRNAGFQNLHALFQSFGKTLFFLFQDPLNLGLRDLKLRKSPAHFFSQRRYQFIKEDLADTQTIPVPDRATKLWSAP